MPDFAFDFETKILLDFLPLFDKWDAKNTYFVELDLDCTLKQQRNQTALKLQNSTPNWTPGHIFQKGKLSMLY